MEKLINNEFSYVRGFNYQPSYGSHGLEIWGERFNLSKIDRELGLGKRYFPKINTIRLWLSHDAFIKDPKQFPDNFDKVLKLGEKYNLHFIPTFFNGWHSFPDFGGISVEQIGSWSKNGRFDEMYLPYLKEIILSHKGNNRILMYDLCNEPFNCSPFLEGIDMILDWLKIVYQTCKNLDSNAKICVGSSPSMEFVSKLESISDIITIHPYYAWNEWVKEKKQLETFLDESVSFANEVNKPLIATETGWGALDDKKRSETLAFELGELNKRNIGFTVHLLHHTLVADGHRPEYGPITAAGYMAFIEEDGSLRPYHEIFNEF